MKMTMKRNFFTVFLAIALSLVFAKFVMKKANADEIYIPIGKARVKKSLLAFPSPKYLSAGFEGGSSGGSVKTIRDTITRDLEFTGLFDLQSESAFIEKADAGITLEKFRITDWSTIGTEFLLKTGVSLSEGNLAFEVRLYDVLGSKQILGKRYVAKNDEARIIGHSAANDIYKSLTGRPGIFFTKIAMVCNKSGTKEIWLTDFDGSNPKQLTSHRTLAFSPAWSRDNRKLAYSLYSKNSKNVKNIDLYEYNFQTRQSRLLSNRRGINSGAAYSPSGRKIALTMSFLGNPEIFLLDPESREVTRLTKSFGVDVDPNFSPDGSKLAFVSSRNQDPMIFMAGLKDLENNPSAAKRITFAGKYNASPMWNMDGSKIVFAGYREGHFDIYLMNPDGSEMERLTKDEGNNEDPYFSPDGNFIAFSSNRTGRKKQVYVMNTDGNNVKAISTGLGQCEAPKWSFESDKPL